MLFDLRGRGRRTTVRGVYLGLAILMGGGLILFGVGTGVGGGGLLNAFGGGGSNSNQPVVSQALKSALAATKQRPNDPQAWSSLVQAYDESAKQNYNSSTQTFTSAGKQDLALETQAFQRYTSLTKQPDSTTAILAARAYAATGNYSGAAKAWEAVTLSDPSQAKGYECLAVSAYAAKQNRKGDLATAKAMTLVPKPQQPLLKEQIVAAKTQPAVAQGC
jgi:predicted Zn-dependent protease